MKYLQGKEITETDQYIKEAIKEAKKSTCQKSKRGIIIVKNNRIIGRGYNNPPLDMICDKESCYNICREYAVHAEQNAIFNALKEGNNLEGSRMYHIKIKEGEIKNSGQPSCVQCSKLVLQSGIEEFVLKHDKGYGLYSAKELHELSLKSIGYKKIKPKQ